MTISGQNFEMYQGETKTIEILVLDENGQAADLTPYVLNDDIQWTAYNRTTKATVIHKSLGDGISVPVTTSGIIIVSLLPLDTESVNPNIYGHECQIASSASDVAIVTTGIVNIYYSKL
jgi:hypothetical protein